VMIGVHANFFKTTNSSEKAIVDQTNNPISGVNNSILFVLFLL